MSDRLPTHVAVGALLRRVNDAGGMAMVRARGDAQAGAVLVLIEGGEGTRALERGSGPDGEIALVEVRRPDSAESVDDYWRRRCARDPDLWAVELSFPEAERLAREALLGGN